MIGWSRAVAYVLVAATMLVLVAILSLASSDSASADHAEVTPTCSTTLDGTLGDNHGEHVLAAYVGDPGGGEGAALPGGPGAGEDGHFDNNVAPGASFCLNEALQSPGDNFGP